MILLVFNKFRSVNPPRMIERVCDQHQLIKHFLYFNLKRYDQVLQQNNKQQTSIYLPTKNSAFWNPILQNLNGRSAWSTFLKKISSMRRKRWCQGKMIFLQGDGRKCKMVSKSEFTPSLNDLLPDCNILFKGFKKCKAIKK